MTKIPSPRTIDWEWPFHYKTARNQFLVTNIDVIYTHRINLKYTHNRSQTSVSESVRSWKIRGFIAGGLSSVIKTHETIPFIVNLCSFKLLSFRWSRLKFNIQNHSTRTGLIKWLYNFNTCNYILFANRWHLENAIASNWCDGFTIFVSVT